MSGKLLNKKVCRLILVHWRLCVSWWYFIAPFVVSVVVASMSQDKCVAGDAYEIAFWMVNCFVLLAKFVIQIIVRTVSQNEKWITPSKKIAFWMMNCFVLFPAFVIEFIVLPFLLNRWNCHGSIPPLFVCLKAHVWALIKWLVYNKSVRAVLDARSAVRGSGIAR